MWYEQERSSVNTSTNAPPPYEPPPSYEASVENPANDRNLILPNYQTSSTNFDGTTDQRLPDTFTALHDNTGYTQGNENRFLNLSNVGIARDEFSKSRDFWYGISIHFFAEFFQNIIFILGTLFFGIIIFIREQ